VRQETEVALRVASIVLLRAAARHDGYKGIPMSRMIWTSCWNLPRSSRRGVPWQVLLARETD